MFRQLLKLLLTLIVLSIVCLGIAAWYLNTNWNKPIAIDDQIFTINSGSSIRKVSRQLNEINIMPDPYSFALLGMYEGRESQIKAGDYQLTGKMTSRQILDRFVQGDVISFKVSLIEGLTFKQFRQRIASASNLKKITANWSDDKIMNAVSEQQIHPEGQFYPDTYVFRTGDSDLDIFRQSYERMRSVLDEAWFKRDKDTPLKNKYEAIILASIIEKETGKASERPTIGGVFTNRLNKGMLLQTDPTIIYGLGDQFNGNLTKKHLKDESNLYNTYAHSGLPPTPIAMPGKESLLAAVAPEKTDYYYFVARGDGSHEFTSTYKEHQRAVYNFQIKRKSKG